MVASCQLPVVGSCSVMRSVSCQNLDFQDNWNKHK